MQTYDVVVIGAGAAGEVLAGRVVAGGLSAVVVEAELVHAATVAVVGRVPMERLRHAVPSYPTTSEVWLRLLEEYGQ